jgi:hypothetical protein
MMKHQIQGQQFGDFMDSSKPTMKDQMQGQQRSKDTMTTKNSYGILWFSMLW